jgi:hypothetical protein
MTYNSLLLSPAESKTFATNNGTISLSKLVEVLLKIASLDNFSVQDTIEVGVADDVIADSLVLAG